MAPIFFRDVYAVDMTKNERIKKQLELQTMVAGRGFVVRAISQYLLFHFVQQLAQTKLAPFLRRSKLRQHHADPEQSSYIRKIMIAGGDMRELKIPLNMRAMLIEHLEQIL